MGAEETALSLLPDLKRSLRINYDFDDANLATKLQQGMAWLDQRCGMPLNYIPHDLPRIMLMAWVRYEYNQVLELFEQNFASELLNLQLAVATGNVPVIKND